MLLPIAFIAAALPYLACAVPVRRSLWSQQTCTGSSAGDIEMGEDLPAVHYSYLLTDLVAETTYTTTGNKLNHKAMCTSANDTSVIIVKDGGDLKMNYVDFLKYGYSSNLEQASFYGLNSIVNVQNGSTATANHINMTAYNGAAGIFVYGTGSQVSSSHSQYYATGPVSHGLYAAGNGTINATHFYCETHGYRSSCLSGDGPAGYLTIEDSEAYTYGLGSAVIYTLGQSILHNVHGYADKSPWNFMDGSQETIVTNSVLEGGNLGSVVLFGSQGVGHGRVNVSESVLKVHDAGAAAFAVGGTMATIGLNSVVVQAESGILVVANASTIHQSFDKWYPAGEDGRASPIANAYVYVSSSNLDGDLIAVNGSSIDWYLNDHSVWTGSARLDNDVNTGALGVYLDKTSAWILTADVALQNFTGSLDNVVSNGFSITYNASAEANAWLGGATKDLTGGGKISPM